MDEMDEMGWVFIPFHNRMLKNVKESTIPRRYPDSAGHRPDGNIYCPAGRYGQDNGQLPRRRFFINNIQIRKSCHYHI